MYCTNHWVLASNNAGKLREFNDLLAPLAIKIQPQAELEVPDAIEDGLSFIENALIKARHAARLTGLPALSDDSGLEVDALQGAPGIYSARYASMAGGDKSDLANLNKLLVDLKDVPRPSEPLAFIAYWPLCAMPMIRHRSLFRVPGKGLCSRHRPVTRALATIPFSGSRHTGAVRRS